MNVLKKLSRNFKNLYYSQLFSNVGDIIYVIALIAYVYKTTEDVRISTLIPIIITFFLFLSGLVSTYAYNRWGDLNILFSSQTAKTILMSMIAITIYSKMNILVLFIFIALNSLLDGLINPVKNSLIPRIETESKIMYANSKMNIMNNIIQVSSWGLGGILMTIVGYHMVIIITIVLYITSLIFIRNISLDGSNDSHQSIGIVKEFTLMLKFNLKNKNSMYLNTTTLIESFAHSAWIAAILLVFVKEFLNEKEFMFGLINSVFFGGIILAGYFITKYSDYIERRTKWVLIGFGLINAILNLTFSISSWLIFVFGISFLYGFSDQIRAITIHSTIQKRLQSDTIIKVYTLNNMVYSLGFCIGTFAISFVVDKFNVNMAYIVAGLAYIVSSILSLNYIKSWGKS